MEIKLENNLQRERERAYILQRERERAYIAGQRSVWKKMLMESLNSLGHPAWSSGPLAAQVEAARAELVMLCEAMGVGDPQVGFADEPMHLADLVKRVTQALVDDRRAAELNEVSRFAGLGEWLHERLKPGDVVEPALFADFDQALRSAVGPYDEIVSPVFEAGQRLHDAADQFREMVRRARGLGDETTAVLTARLVLEAAVRNWESLSVKPDVKPESSMTKSLPLDIGPAYKRRTEEEKTQLAEEVITFLNDVLCEDRHALRRLLTFRTRCNHDLMIHPTVQTGVVDGEPDVGLLGLINGLIGVRPDGWGYVTCHLADNGVILGFSLTKREGSDP